MFTCLDIVLPGKRNLNLIENKFIRTEHIIHFSMLIILLSVLLMLNVDVFKIVFKSSKSDKSTKHQNN